MSIKSAPYYWLECDAEGCEVRSPHPDSEVAAWGDVDGAVETAKAEDWLVGDERAYCYDHALYVCSRCGKMDETEFPGERDYLCVTCAAESLRRTE